MWPNLGILTDRRPIDPLPLQIFRGHQTAYKIAGRHEFCALQTTSHCMLLRGSQWNNLHPQTLDLRWEPWFCEWQNLLIMWGSRNTTNASNFKRESCDSGTLWDDADKFLMELGTATCVEKTEECASKKCWIPSKSEYDARGCRQKRLLATVGLDFCVCVSLPQARGVIHFPTSRRKPRRLRSNHFHFLPLAVDGTEKENKIYFLFVLTGIWSFDASTLWDDETYAPDRMIFLFLSQGEKM